MQTTAIIAAAYLLLRFEGSGLSNDNIQVIPYLTLRECNVALEHIKKAGPQPDAECVPGSTDFHDPDANKP